MSKGLTRRGLMRGVGSLALASSFSNAAEAREQPRAPAYPSPAVPSPATMDTLAAYMAEADGRPLPGEVVEKAKEHILDTFAAMISGSALSPGQIALKFAALHSGGYSPCTVAGSDVLAGPLAAALANGMLAHADETDDSHAPSHSHPGCAVVPAALALGEQSSLSGERFLRAVTLGYDIGTRLLMALGGLEFQVRTHHDAHSMANTFGSAAAAGSASGLRKQQMRWLLDYAAQQAAGIAAWQRDTRHIEKAFVFGGAPARNGVTAASLIAIGATGVDDVFSGPDNFFLAFAPETNPNGLIEGLGQRYEITRTNIKKWSVGSPIQAPLDALARIMEQHPFTPEEVESVVVHLATSEAKTVNDREMPDISLQQMIAVMLLDGTVSFRAAHDRARIEDPAAVRERAKVRLVPDAELERLYPRLVAVVEVVLRDGRRWTERVDDVRGTVRNSMSRGEVVSKSRDLMEPVLGPTQSGRLIEAVLALDTLANIGALRPLLQKKQSQ